MRTVKKAGVVLLVFLLLFAQLAFLISSVWAASNPWTQTDWSGGSGQTAWSDATKFDSSANITTSTAGQATLTAQEKFSNTGFETDLTSWTASPKTFSDTSFAAASGAVAAWPLDDTTTTQSYARVINPADSEGRDMVINGGFNSDTIWTKGTGWTIAGGVAHSDGTGNNASLLQSIPTVYGKSYQVTFTVSNYISGGVRMVLGDPGRGSFVTANGTYTQTHTGGSGTQNLYIQQDLLASGSFIGDIDNVSVKQLNIPASSSFTGTELLTDGDMEAADTSAWTAFNNATLTKQTTTQHGSDSGKVLKVAYSDTANPYARQAVLTVGKTYRTTGWLRGDGAGVAIPRIENSTANIFVGTNSNTWQYFDVTFVSDGNSFNLRSLGASGYGEFDDISVIEVDPLVGKNTNGVTLGSTATGHLTNAYTFDGSNDVVNIYSSDLNSVFNPSEGTLVAWAKVSGSGVWTDSTTRIITLIRADLNNTIRLSKDSSQNNNLYINYSANGTNKEIFTPLTSTDWFQVGISWSKSNDQVIFYVNGAQVGSTLTGLGTWTGNLSSTNAVIGALSSTGTSPWSGDINDARLYNRALSPTEIANLYSGIAATRDTGTKYAGTASSKLVSYEGYNGTFVQSVNVGTTETYQLEAYAYIDGSTAVTDSYAELYYNGSAITTAYTSVGSGWYKLTGTLTGANAARDYGILVKADKTVYVDNLSLWNYPTSATLTSSIFDAGWGAAWGTLSYTATTPTNTAASVKVRTSNASDMTGATAFASCSVISSGSDVSGNACVTDGQRYAQYLVTLSDTDYLTTPTFSDFSLTFADTTAPATFSLESPGNNSYTSSERPTFRWHAESSDANGLSKYVLEIDNPSLGSGQPSGDFTIDDIPVSRTTDYETNRYLIQYENFNDSDAANNYISVHTKSSTDWSAEQNDGKLREGIINWKVKVVDLAGNETSSSRTVFVDRTNPTVAISQVNSSPFSAPAMSTTDTTPTISGKITDPLAGGDPALTQTANGPKVASGPKQVNIKVEKKSGSDYILHTIATVNAATLRYTCDDTEVSDNSLQKCDKYFPLAFTPAALDVGAYRITISGKDNVDNSASETSFTLNVSTLAQITTPEEQKIIEAEIQALPEEEREKAKEELEITVPGEPSAPQEAGGQIAQTVQNITSGIVAGTRQLLASLLNLAGNSLALVGNTIGTAWSALYNYTGSALAFAGRIAGDGLSYVGKVASSVIAAIGGGYNQIASNAPGLARTILTGIGNGVSGITSAMASATNSLASTSASIAQLIGKAASSIAQATSALAQNVGGAIGQGTDSALTVLATASKNAGSTALVVSGAIRDAGKKTADLTNDAIAKATFAVGGKIQDVSDTAGIAIMNFGSQFVTEPTRISDVRAVVISPTSVKISWVTNHPANGKVNWGYEDGVYEFENQTDKRTTEHEFVLTDLKPDTQYHYEVMSHNKNYVYDANRQFKTPQ